MYKGAIFFDYDGTLADERDNIYIPTKTSVDAINTLSQNGYLTVLATGRAKCYIPDLSINFGGLVTTNGAYGEINGKPIYNKLIDEDLLNEAITFMDKHNIFYALENQDVCYAKDITEKHFTEVLENFNINKNVFRPLSDMKKPIANKLFITYPSFDTEALFIKEFEGRLSSKRHRFCVSSDVDIFGISKANAIEAIIKAANIKRENTYAFGDGSNDYTMLKSVGHAIAMTPHFKGLEEVAEFITGSVKNEGIYTALKHYNLL